MGLKLVAKKNKLKNRKGKKQAWKMEELKMAHRDLNLGVANKTNDTKEERNS